MKNEKSLLDFLLFLFLVFMFLGLGPIDLSAQESDKITLSGYIKDSDSGEELINASLYIPELEIGVVSNLYGFYSITLSKGNHSIIFSYLGYDDQILNLQLDADLRKDIKLVASGHLIEEIVVSAKQVDENIQSTQMSSVNVDIEAVKKLPALLGEVDIIKAIQLLPGVKSLGEGTSGFYVRGGNADQNLVLLDEAPIYNASHMLGFFSSFNPDAIKDMQLYKGAISSRYGGRLSSVLDIRMKEGRDNKFGGTAGIGTIMSRLSLEAPLSSKGSFIVSGRRSYLDLVAPLFLPKEETRTGEEQEQSKFYFYDLNAKANFKLNENNRIFASGYFGRDVISAPDEGIDVSWGNKTASLRWNHIFSPKIFSNLTFYYSSYDYGLGIVDVANEVKWESNLEEFSLKADASYFMNPKHSLSFGFHTIRHDLEPGNITITEKDSVIADFMVEDSKTLENAIYLEHEWKASPQLSLNSGLRISSLHNLGPHTHYTQNDNSEILDSTVYGSGIYHSSYNLEPRLGLKYSLSNRHSIKSSYNRTVQYIQQASNGNASTPFDVWFTSSPMIKPQLADQLALGYFRNFKDNSIEASVEMYYKKFSNSIDFKERAVLLLNKNLEGEVRTGDARAYGLEFMLKKDVGRLTGWFGYTLSKVEKKIDQINEGKWYNAKYDKTHDLSLVLSYKLKDNLSLSSNFVYSTGSAVTFPTGRYEFQGVIVPIYSERNAERLPDYHRADVSLSWKRGKKFLGKIESEWVLSVYNVYDRRNAYAINFKQEPSNPKASYAEKASVFSIVPSLTYNAKF